MSAKPRILFFGYSEVGYACLSLLLERGDNVVALITHEDNPHEKIWFKTPAVAAREKGIPVFTPESRQHARVARAHRGTAAGSDSLRLLPTYDRN